MDKFALAVAIFLLIFLAAFQFINAYFYYSFLEGNSGFLNFLYVFFSGIIVVLAIKYMYKKYRREYDIAYKITYTPKNRYGWYGLLSFIAFIFLIVGYGLLTK